MIDAITLKAMQDAGFELAHDFGTSTLTFTSNSPLAIGHTIRVEDGRSSVWYGTVDNDGVALLTRSDLLPAPRRI